MKWLDIVNKSKKIRHGSRYAASLLKPKAFYRSSLARILESANQHDQRVIEDRVNYYNKLTDSFLLDDPISMKSHRIQGSSELRTDFKSVIRYFDSSQCFHVKLGDFKHLLESPTFIKCRPVDGDNKNSVILKLESARHFNFVNDPTPFHKKKNMALWRGAVFKRGLRIKLLEDFMDHPKCDLGDTDKTKRGEPTFSPRMRFSKQLENKFIISIEGNDVATNTKWIMSSNSLCFMPIPKYETWFMEVRLKPGFHYVPLKNDFSDLEEKIDYYSEHTDEALEIIQNAHDYVATFRNRERERLISLFVVRKYLRLCENNAHSDS